MYTEESTHFVSRNPFSQTSLDTIHPKHFIFISHPKFITRLALLIERNLTPSIIYSYYLILIVICLIGNRDIMVVMFLANLDSHQDHHHFPFAETTARAFFKVNSSSRLMPKTKDRIQNYIPICKFKSQLGFLIWSKNQCPSCN